MTPETYRGWWRLSNLPNGRDFDGWFNGSPDEINNPNLSLNEVAEIFQIQTFEDWKASGIIDVDFHDANSLDEYIAYWRAERDIGTDYYGQENEVTGTTS